MNVRTPVTILLKGYKRHSAEEICQVTILQSVTNKYLIVFMNYRGICIPFAFIEMYFASRCGSFSWIFAKKMTGNKMISLFHTCHNLWNFEYTNC